MAKKQTTPDGSTVVLQDNETLNENHGHPVCPKCNGRSAEKKGERGDRGNPGVPSVNCDLCGNKGTLEPMEFDRFTLTPEIFAKKYPDAASK